jgi:hypothetical protein
MQSKTLDRHGNIGLGFEVRTSGMMMARKKESQKQVQQGKGKGASTNCAACSSLSQNKLYLFYLSPKVRTTKRLVSV